MSRYAAVHRPSVYHPGLRATRLNGTDIDNKAQYLLSRGSHVFRQRKSPPPPPTGSVLPSRFFVRHPPTVSYHHPLKPSLPVLIAPLLTSSSSPLAPM